MVKEVIRLELSQKNRQKRKLADIDSPSFLLGMKTFRSTNWVYERCKVSYFRILTLWYTDGVKSFNSSSRVKIFCQSK